MKFALLLVGLLTFSNPASAGQKFLTWKSQPLSQTKFFLITEHGFDLTLHGNDTPGNVSNSNFDFVWALGIARNITKAFGLGIVIEGATEKVDFPISIKGRVRFWLHESVCLDFGYGRTVGAFSNGSFGINQRLYTYPHIATRLEGAGTTIDFGISLNNWIGLYLRRVSLPYRSVEYPYQNIEPRLVFHDIKSLHGGVRFHYKLGLATSLIIPISYLVHALVEART